MTKDLLVRGLAAGFLAAVLATLFARLFAEPHVDLAIAFEAAHSAHHMGDGPELVSRGTQKGIGLLVALGLYGTAIGGLFALVFAVSYRRIGQIGPRGLALMLAAAGFLAITLVPALKYPATPPAVGQHETVALRTACYFAMIILSLAALVAAWQLAVRLARRYGRFDGYLYGAVAYFLTVSLAAAVLPLIDEVPADFPATLLWHFRIASLGTQAILWATLGLVFGALARDVVRQHRAPGSLALH